MSVEASGKDAPRIEIMLGGGDNLRHLTHTITRVNHVMQKLDADGRDEAIEFEDAGGAKTLLQFEVLTEMKASS
jgi:phosphotransferase system IIB component